MASQIALNFPNLYPMQQAIYDSPAKRKIGVTGRRTGKTTLAGDVAANGLLDKKKVLYCATTQEQTDTFWRRIKEMLMPLVSGGLVHKNETSRILEGLGGRIRAKTGHEPDVLRGDDADILILDEAAYLNPAAWFDVGAPMLLDRDGVAYFFTTPNRKNWIHQLYQRAKADQSGRWEAWNFPTTANPYLSKVALAEIAGDLTENSYRQEILGEFLESGGEVFRNIDKCATLQPRDPYAGSFSMGIDWAQKVDYTVISVIDTATRELVALDRFNGVGWALQRGRVISMFEKWKPITVIAEENSIGSPNIEALQADGIPVTSFQTTSMSKPPLIESLALAFEREQIHIIDDGVLTGELAAYERKVSGTTGRSQFSAPDGLHDDTVMSLALAWYGVMHSGFDISFVKSTAPRQRASLFAGMDS